MAVTAKRITVTGRVTGVGFRFATLCQVEGQPGLTGYVRNAGRAEVECFLQGDEAAVQAIVEWLHQGPPGAHVLTCQVSDVRPLPDLRDFRILH